MLGWTKVHAQEQRMEIFVNFRVNSTQIEYGYQNNAYRISNLISFLQNLRADSTMTIVSTSFCGAASPEGSYGLNKRLASRRMKALEEIVRNHVNIPDSIVTYDDNFIPWSYLAEQVQESDMPEKDEIVRIIQDTHPQPESRIQRLKALDDGKVWRKLYKRYFCFMRNAGVVFVTYKQVSPTPQPTPQPVAAPTVTPQPAPTIADTVAPQTSPVVEKWRTRVHVKTNVAGLGIGIANAAVEVELCKHLSLSVPVYYSAWDYFKPTLKFRTMGMQPEIRYWFSNKNDGFFLGAHMGLLYYNFAFDEEFRIQDHDGKSPALGGGLSLGYRLPISKSGRWNMEFSVGAGIYDLHYDRFRNYTDGLLVDTKRDMYYGIDQAAITFMYSFGRKKGGKK